MFKKESFGCQGKYKLLSRKYLVGFLIILVYIVESMFNSIHLFICRIFWD